VYFFRLYLSLVVLGALHGLVLLPVLLAVAGPPSLTQSAALGKRASALARQGVSGQE
jgi:Niemann-Pick C1 protein